MLMMFSYIYDCKYFYFFIANLTLICAEQQTSLVDIPGLVELRSSRQQHPLQKQVGKSHASSCCSKMGSDLPFLMHALPVIASVCVPRPVPLVQSNVTIPVAASLNPASVSQVYTLTWACQTAVLCCEVGELVFHVYVIGSQPNITTFTACFTTATTHIMQM